jgi:hypothetical protein
MACLTLPQRTAKIENLFSPEHLDDTTSLERTRAKELFG